MNLIFDIGNTLTKVAIFDASKVVFSCRIRRLSAARVLKILKPYGEQVKKAIISSTTTIPGFLTGLLTSSGIGNVVILSHKTKLPFVIQYDTPETLGSDRIAGAAGAIASSCEKDILLIDAGSAITFDYISDNKFVGGNISLGMNIRFKALHKYTSRLPLVAPPTKVTTPGKSTGQAIVAGVIFGVVYEINEYIRTFLEQHPGGKVILTGGDGEYLEGKLGFPVHYMPDIVISGLNYILENDAK